MADTLFSQPVEKILSPPLLDQLEGLDQCGQFTTLPEVTQCVDGQMNRLADELLHYSKSRDLVSTFVTLKDGTSHNPRKICRNNFDVLIESAKRKAKDAKYLEMGNLIKQAVLFARMGGIDKETIRKAILAIVKLRPSVREGPGIAEPVKVVVEQPVPLQEGVAFIEQKKESGLLLNGGPLATYGGNNERVFLGAGVYLELTAPFKAGSPYVFGGELQLLGKLDYDSLNIPAGELKTTRVEFFPLLEVGFHGRHTSVFFQGGAWFSKYRLFDASEERDPHSESMFENLNFRSGVKTYLLDNCLRLGGGYQRTPWGNGAYLDLGFNTELWGGGKQ